LITVDTIIEHSFLFPMVRQPLIGQGLLTHDASRSHSNTLHSGQEISPSQTALPDDKQHSQQTAIHAPGGIRKRNPGKPAAAAPHLRPRGRWDRQLNTSTGKILRKISAADYNNCKRRRINFAATNRTYAYVCAVVRTTRGPKHSQSSEYSQNDSFSLPLLITVILQANFF
jgi:hypothetical protein